MKSTINYCEIMIITCLCCFVFLISACAKKNNQRTNSFRQDNLTKDIKEKLEDNNLDIEFSCAIDKGEFHKAYLVFQKLESEDDNIEGALGCKYQMLIFPTVERGSNEWNKIFSDPSIRDDLKQDLSLEIRLEQSRNKRDRERVGRKRHPFK